MPHPGSRRFQTKQGARIIGSTPFLGVCLVALSTSWVVNTPGFLGQIRSLFVVRRSKCSGITAPPSTPRYVSGSRGILFLAFPRLASRGRVAGGRSRSGLLASGVFFAHGVVSPNIARWVAYQRSISATRSVALFAPVPRAFLARKPRPSSRPTPRAGSAAGSAAPGP